MTEVHTAENAIAPLRSGMKIFVHGAAATPTPLLDDGRVFDVYLFDVRAGTLVPRGRGV